VLELTLGLLLFTEAMKLRLESWGDDFELATRLLAIGMPLTIALGAIVAVVVFPDIGLLEGAAIATVLAPTDAALGLAVVENPRVPGRIREALAVESGLNDGIALPVLLFFLAFFEAEEGEQFATLLAQGVGIAVIVGVTFGLVAGFAMREVVRRGWMQGRWQQITVVVVPLMSLVIADQLGGSGFIATFVAGLVFGRMISEISEMDMTVAGFADDLGTALTMISFALFGGVILFNNLDWFSARTLLYAAISLTLIRMVPVAISMIGTDLRARTVGFMGWFGPRGLASIIFGAVVVEEVGMEGGEVIVGTMVVVVTLSILLHGVTAYNGADAYADWVESSTSAP
jgi:NhaP-type Na+/H+ or K+/H+ antiporter